MKTQSNGSSDEEEEGEEEEVRGIGKFIRGYTLLN